MGLAPEILPDLPGRLKYTKYQPKINEALIDKQVDDFARRYGKLTSVEKAGERDMIMANFKELDQSGNVLLKGLIKVLLFRWNSSQIKNQRENLLVVSLQTLFN